jgi:hypothetical protein
MLSFVSGKNAVGSLGKLVPPGFLGGNCPCKWSKGDMMLRGANTLSTRICEAAALVARYY